MPPTTADRGPAAVTPVLLVLLAGALGFAGRRSDGSRVGTLLGAAGLVCNQLAHQAGSSTASLPTITVVDPLAAVVMGVVFDEELRHTALTVVGEVVCLLLLLVAVVRLTRLERPVSTGEEQRAVLGTSGGVDT